MSEFKISFLDHVAIRVKDLKASADWYETGLGLKRYQLPEWGAFPIFMLSNKTGIALFPAKDVQINSPVASRKGHVDHFAFNVTGENFEKAKKRYNDLGLEFDFQDHFYFHSIYTKDLDGYTVELTTIKVDEASFYE